MHDIDRLTISIILWCFPVLRFLRYWCIIHDYELIWRSNTWRSSAPMSDTPRFINRSVSLGVEKKTVDSTNILLCIVGCKSYICYCANVRQLSFIWIWQCHKRNCSFILPNNYKGTKLSYFTNVALISCTCIL